MAAGSGLIGWKEYADRKMIEAPAFIVDELRRMTPAGAIENAAHLLISAADGLRDALGIELHPDVLPFSNIPAWLPPFLLRPDRAMTMTG
jgi:hypothetical protein